MLGQLNPRPATREAGPVMALPAPSRDGALVMVADHAGMKMVPASKRESCASVAAGAFAQNVYLFCASAGLATVTRAWFDRAALTLAIGLGPDQQIVLAQTVGRPKG
ncbi:hypothetical protein FHP08_05490 [Zeimonas arvi]|uniref:Nitroreductase domain-containing protein n=2 Tax=Zeimonas arvi TaxID=2498847 RepID=A0A5C8P1D5_9BURK|nr:hypothetical protein FHP08_05490 [Zeimonas arvi]